MWKLIRKILKYIIIILTVIFLVFTVLGYAYYQQAIAMYPIEETIDEIRAQDNYVVISEISNDFLNAVVAVEDNGFYQRYGIDLVAISRALVTNIFSGEIVMGGSTITQQLSKNIFFTQEQFLIRKFAEVFMVYKLEDMYTKDEILELYVNINYYGDSFTGIKDASLGYFDVLPIDLNLAQASLLAGLPNAPSVYQLSNGLELAKKRQKIVLDYMVKFECITQTEADKAYKEDIGY